MTKLIAHLLSFDFNVCSPCYEVAMTRPQRLTWLAAGFSLIYPVTAPIIRRRSSFEPLTIAQVIAAKRAS